MAEIVHNCPLCGSPESSEFDRRTFRDYPVINRVCLRCGLVYQTPRMTEAESQAFYEEGYRSLYQGQEKPRPEDLAIQERRARLVMEFLGGLIKPTSPTLDIGCSAGMLLEQFQERFQVPAYGVEPGKMYRAYACSTGLNVYPSLDELELAVQKHFSLVSMMHVLEHLPSPLTYLLHLREQLIEPDGWLLLEVPNLYAHDCFEVAHLVSFSAHSLTQLVELAGYKVVKLRAHGLPRSRLIPLYLTLLAQPTSAMPGSKPVRMEKGVMLKRRYGLFQRKIIERLAPRYAWQTVWKDHQ